MPKTFQLYIALLLALAGAQIVIASETVVDFRNALQEYEKEREPSEARDSNKTSKVENPAIEISLKQAQELPNDSLNAPQGEAVK